MGGKIITFYSYKGGTGRSLALANVAWILASRGQRVLCIDWDLEAPGLHRYFSPFLSDAQLADTPGLIDWLFAYVQAATSAPPSPAAEQTTPQPARPWFTGYANIARYAQPVGWSFAEGGQIDFVGAGQQGASYALRVNGLNWDRFYTEFGGSAFLEHCADRLRQDYQWVLIDSRTGISDTAGICTVQMPDAVALFFTLNNQSIEGVAGIARDMLRARSVARKNASTSAATSDSPAVLTMPRPLQLFPCATRIELAEKHKLERRRRLVEERFKPLIAQSGTSLPAGYLGEMEVLYDPFYAYDEMLATIADQPGRTNSVLAAMERLTGFLTDGRVTRLGPISETLRQDALRRYELHDANQGRAPETQGKAVEVGAATAYDVVVTAAANDHFLARSLRRLLSTVGKPFFAPDDLEPGADYASAIERVFAGASLMVVVVSQRSVGVAGLAHELDLARRHGFRIVPVVVGSLGREQLGELSWLMDLNGIAVAGEEELPKVVERIKPLLGVRDERASDDTAGVEVWRERAAYADLQVKRLRTWFAVSLLILLVTSLPLFLYSLHQSRELDAKRTSSAEAERARAKLQQSLRDAQAAQKKAETDLSNRDNATIRPLRLQLDAVRSAVDQWLTSSGALVERIAAFKDDVGKMSAEEVANLEPSASDVDVSSGVAESLASKLGDVKAQIDSAELSAEIKNDLVGQAKLVSDKMSSRQAQLSASADRLARLMAGRQHGQIEQARIEGRLGYAAYERFDLAAARRHYEAATKLDPNYAPAISSLGTIAADGGRYEEAAKLYQEAFKRNPKYAPAAGNMAALQNKLGNRIDAQRWLDRALKANANYVPIVDLNALQMQQSPLK